MANIDLSTSPDQADIMKKVLMLGYPDVVMVPEQNTKKGPIADNLIEPKLYSKIRGMVAVVRADDMRIKGLDDLKKTDARFVLAGSQSQRSHAMFTSPEQFFGKELFDQIKKRPSTGYSQITHHRSVPARILTKCEDVGFQFAQSQPYLEKRFPGKFRFFMLPRPSMEVFDDENSYIAITKNSAHKEAATKFVDFIMSSRGQSILDSYKLSLK